MISDYAMIPYRERGRTFAGADCWGFVRLQLIHEDGIPAEAVPEFGSLTRRAVTEMTGAYHAAKSSFELLPRPVPGAVACCFDSDGNFRHVGRVVRDGSQLMVSHTQFATGPALTGIREFVENFHTVAWWAYVR